MNNLARILSPGTQVVSRMEIRGADGRPLHPAGVVGVIVAAPVDHQHAYRVRLPDGFEAALKRLELLKSAFPPPEGYALFPEQVRRRKG